MSDSYVYSFLPFRITFQIKRIEFSSSGDLVENLSQARRDRLIKVLSYFNKKKNKKKENPVQGGFKLPADEYRGCEKFFCVFCFNEYILFHNPHMYHMYP